MATGDSEDRVEPPNIICILADDLGYGDLISYGQEKFKTPHIDKLASQRTLFTQHYSGITVCAPSRSALLTGMHRILKIDESLWGIKNFFKPNFSLTVNGEPQSIGYFSDQYYKIKSYTYYQFNYV